MAFAWMLQDVGLDFSAFRALRSCESVEEVMLLGSAGNHVQQMKAMGFGKGDWKGWGKGWDWGKGYNMYMMPTWKGYGKGW